MSRADDPLRARLDGLEREHAEQIARAHDAIASAQERSYWLDRWNLDLNALMERRGAGHSAPPCAVRALWSGSPGGSAANWHRRRPHARRTPRRRSLLMSTVSVVIPVKDGAESLGRLLEALRDERPDEVLVIDSGSSDGSRELARAAGAEVLSIAPEEFGHGRTRNLGAERTSGELICFLTQDAVPLPGWLDAYRRAFALGERVGAAYGPHLPLDSTSPMIARELAEFFAAFAPNGHPVVQGPGDPVFLSNVNACYRRDCWQEIRFPDVPYAEDQAFARAMLAAGWTKVYEPRPRVLHAHDYGPVEFMRRYFDEYRGLRETLGHVEPLTPRSVLGLTRRQVAADRRWMRERSWPAGRRARWTARSALHHSSRQLFAGLGSRAEPPPGPRSARHLARGQGRRGRTGADGRGDPAGAALGGGGAVGEGGAGAARGSGARAWRRASSFTSRW